MIQDERLFYIQEKLDSLDEKLTLVRVDIAGLKVKSSIWGIIGGSIPILVLLAINLFKGG